MHVVATAGHVDHGKSTLVRALTGMEPDRWAEERRRGMTIDLGFAWTRLPSGEQVAFVDVPGHERFVPNMLAGVGPVPAVLLVVAADEGWMPQTAEHVAALDALGVEHGVLAVTRCDLADGAPAVREARAELAGTTLARVPAVRVSAATGAGLGDLVHALETLAADLPAPDLLAPVRLWIDRAFTIRGSGTVVTGTLTAGRLRVGDALTLAGAAGERPVRVRGLHSLGTAAREVPGVARVAVNLRGVDREDVTRGDLLLAPGRWRATSAVDVRVEERPGTGTADGVEADGPGRGTALTLHVGSASVPVRVRPLGGGTVRLALAHPLPLTAGDVALLRDPGAHRVVGRVTVLDTEPPPLLRRGAAAARARELAEVGSQAPDGGELLRRRKVARVGELRGVGAQVPPAALAAGEWLVDPEHAATLRARLARAVAEHRRRAPLEPGPTLEAVRSLLDLPDRSVVPALAVAPLTVRDGRVVDATAPSPLPAAVAEAVAALREDLRPSPFAAPDARRLVTLGLGTRELAVAERAGAVLRVADGVVLLPGADVAAAALLAALPQPFTLSQARQALDTTRRVAVPLLELLDRRRLTRRLPDDRRSVISGEDGPDAAPGLDGAPGAR